MGGFNCCGLTLFSSCCLSYYDHLTPLSVNGKQLNFSYYLTPKCMPASLSRIQEDEQ